jgi:hypothetical protein
VDGKRQMRYASTPTQDEESSADLVTLTARFGV